MTDDNRIWSVKDLLFEYLKSPSLRHIRDPYSVSKLAKEIVKRMDRGSSIWQKWEGQREVLVKMALGCWIPTEDLRAALNRLPGPQLTTTDVDQRLKALEEEDYTFANEDLKAGCLALYEKEKAEGTELPAIIRLLREHVDREEDRLQEEQQEQYRRNREEEQTAKEQRLASGADCRWTQPRNSVHWYYRLNGRTYRLSPTKDKKWQLHRVNSLTENEEGSLIGTYQRRGDASKVIATAAYQSEPRW